MKKHYAGLNTLQIRGAEIGQKLMGVYLPFVNPLRISKSKINFCELGLKNKWPYHEYQPKNQSSMTRRIARLLSKT